MEYRINGAGMVNPRAAHEVIAAAMDFPDYYGKNLDALWDMLTTTEGSVIIDNVSVMLNALGGYGCKLLRVFYEAAEENKRLSFSVEK